MKLGDYVRTKNGNIRKIVELSNTKFIDDPDCYVDKVLINIEQNKAEDTIYMEKWLFEEEIVKSSPSIIDLIEIGDYVNGYKVSFVDEEPVMGNFVQCDYEVPFGTTNHYRFYKADIKSIVTHEQFSQMEYRIGE